MSAATMSSEAASCKKSLKTPTPLLESLSRDGYVVIPNLIPSDQVKSLQTACNHITGLARKGQWSSIRSVPKQYPPWQANTPGTNIWGVQHLLHPDMPNRDIFANLYFNSIILDPIKQLLALENDDEDENSNSNSNNHNTSSDDNESKLVMELFNLLVSPGQSTSFELSWHRDDIKPTLTATEELAELAIKSPQGRQLHAQYNVALYPDSSLIVVPGSHRRARTDLERNADAYEAYLPGQIKVGLQPGDAVFYDSNILHRGVYEGINEAKEIGRMTLHGSVGLAGHGTERARQVLQHAVGQWIDDEKASFAGLGLDAHLECKAEAMRRRLIAMGRGEGLGYSLDG